MTSRITLPGTITSGILSLDRAEMARQIARFDDGEVCVDVYKPHSDKMRRFYFGCVLREIGGHIGCDKIETHWLMKEKFNNGESITKLDNGEMADLLDRIIRWSAEWLGVVIPDADPSWREHLTDRR